MSANPNSFNQHNAAGETFPLLQGHVASTTFRFANAAGEAPPGLLRQRVNATGGATLPHLGVSASGNLDFNATGGATVPHLTTSASGAERFNLTGGATLPHLTVSAAGSERFNLTGGATLPHLTVTATGGEKFALSGGATLRHLTTAISAAEVFATSGGATCPHLTTSGTGSATQVVQGTGGATCPHLTTSGIGDVSFQRGEIIHVPHERIVPRPWTPPAPILVTGSGGATLPSRQGPGVVSGSGWTWPASVGSGSAVIPARVGRGSAQITIRDIGRGGAILYIVHLHATGSLAIDGIGTAKVGADLDQVRRDIRQQVEEEMLLGLLVHERLTRV